MTSLSALTSNDITKIGIGAIIAIVVIGLVLGAVITALVGRIIVLVVVVALGVTIWQQRSQIEDHVKHCQLDMSFFGVTVHAPKNVVDACHQSQKVAQN